MSKPFRRFKARRFQDGPKVLVFDIETAPILADVWQLFDNNVALNQIVKDWSILSWSAKWLGAPENETMYMDVRNKRDLSDDRGILKVLWRLLCEADIVITHNGKSFDEKRLNARFFFHKFQPPRGFKHFDTRIECKKRFGFTSNKLEYLTQKFNKKYKKLKHKEFPGHDMWSECLKRNMRAWKCMEEYNRYDTLALEELALQFIPWSSVFNVNLYTNSTTYKCNCGSTKFKRNGYCYTSVGKFQRYKCTKCGAEHRGRKNLISAKKSASLRVPVAS